MQKSKHPKRHVLTMAVGSTQDLRISTCIVQLQQGDTILLCSDGLHGVVNEKLLGDALDSEKTLPRNATTLLRPPRTREDRITSPLS